MANPSNKELTDPLVIPAPATPPQQPVAFPFICGGLILTAHPKCPSNLDFFFFLSAYVLGRDKEKRKK